MKAYPGISAVVVLVEPSHLVFDTLRTCRSDKAVRPLSGRILEQPQSYQYDYRPRH